MGAACVGPMNAAKPRDEGHPVVRLPDVLRQLVEQLQHPAGSVLNRAGVEDRPLRGTTLFLASCGVETRMGHFTAHVFQDVIHKGYVIALAAGEVTGAAVLYARIHSSCITSETLRGCDCDCVQQLEGALEVIQRRLESKQLPGNRSCALVEGQCLGRQRACCIVTGNLPTHGIEFSGMERF